MGSLHAGRGLRFVTVAVVLLVASFIFVGESRPALLHLSSDQGFDRFQGGRRKLMGRSGADSNPAPEAHAFRNLYKPPPSPQEQILG
ncbi:hypothetical protein H6P81_008781 [Aristolochia fimbriata]|uniref:Uncharacterized protein n=1 Tax=Aristolochia fimbriata TaxID=158543 RepID=A0AAV7EMB9_ARIFI|nr:hypothetical protein H6P81_008781 [Aristolochia fimbriata]